MNYTITHRQQKLRISSNPKPTFIEWEVNKAIYVLFNEYAAKYTIKNDILIYGHSYFNFLIHTFRTYSFSFDKFIETLSYNELKEHIYNKQFLYYDNLVPPIEDNERNKKLDNDMDNLQPYLDEITLKNNIILAEFKDFVLAFERYIKNLYFNEYSSFKYVSNLLKNDMLFFKNTKIYSLDKYVFTIGGYAKKHEESRGKNNNFIPSGYCRYGIQIFINSEHADRNKHGKLWEKRSLKQTFYHEIGHALDVLYGNDIVLKNNTKRQHSSYNENFLKCCKLGYRRFKYFSPQLSKKSIVSLSYFFSPEITQAPISIKIEPSEIKFNEQLNSTIFSIFNKSKINDVKESIKEFSPVVRMGDNTYDYSRVLEETWSESFALIFDWMKNSFSEYDKFILNAKKSSDRNFIKINYHSLMYMLNNFEWTKLNLPLGLVLRKKMQIKKMLNYANDMPIELSGVNNRKTFESKSKKYLKFNDLLKYR